MTHDDEQAALMAGFYGAYSQGNLDLILQAYLAPDFRAHYPSVAAPLDAEGFRLVNEMLLAAFPDTELTIEDQVSEGDRVATRLTLRATHRGEFQGIYPTGHAVAVATIHLARVADGKVAEMWVEFDALRLMQQLGVLS